jgi:GNAT superfamily N-acetyltransferase
MVKIKQLSRDDILAIVSSFAAIGWDKPPTLYEKYLKEQDEGERDIWLAFIDDIFVGYVTLKYNSEYKPFSENTIPEIMDLNVLPEFRNRGIGSKLLEIAEEKAKNKYTIVGLGVGLYSGYGSAQRLYYSKGYKPNGLGITYNYKEVEYGEKVPLDDELILWLTKQL